MTALSFLRAGTTNRDHTGLVPGGNGLAAGRSRGAAQAHGRWRAPNPQGSKPGDILIYQPTKLELLINLKTAKAARLQSAAGPTRPRCWGHRI